MIFDVQSDIRVTIYPTGKQPSESGVFMEEGSDVFEIWQTVKEGDSVRSLPFAWVKKNIPGIGNSLIITINELNVFWSMENDFQVYHDEFTFH